MRPIQGEINATIACGNRIVAATIRVASSGYRLVTRAATPGIIAALEAKNSTMHAAKISRRLSRKRLLTPSKVILEVPTRREAIAGEPVQRRLGELAAALGRKGEILVG